MVSVYRTNDWFEGQRGDHAFYSVIYSRNATRPLESVVITNRSERPCAKMSILPMLFMRAQGGGQRSNSKGVDLDAEQKCGAVGQNCHGRR